MPEIDLIIRGKSVALPEFGQPASTRVRVVPASIHIKNGLITAIAAYDDIQPQIMLETVSEDSIIMPGLVDTHVHINEPGRTEWEGFATATRAAAAGGVTTPVDMPLNSIPPTTTA